MSNDDKSTLIQAYTTATISGFMEKALSLQSISHKPTKGQLRELLVNRILDRYLTSQFSVGSGIVVNQRGEQSNQTDVVIFDNRVLPPLISEKSLGVYPRECVVSTIEVKSNLNKKCIEDADEAAGILLNKIYDPRSSIYEHEDKDKAADLNPLCALFGYYGNGVQALRAEDSGKAWLETKVSNLKAICLADEFSWIKLESGWAFEGSNSVKYEQTKRFFALLIDNFRHLAEKRFRKLSEKHKDYIGIYTRNQDMQWPEKT